MDELKSPGQDLFEALQWEMHNADPDHAMRARSALFDTYQDNPAKPAPWKWGTLPAHIKAIFVAAALRFLSE